MTEKPLNVVIVGGSLTGLFHGIVLKNLGHNVRILERANPESLCEQGAGIVAREEVQESFSKHDRFADQPYFVPGDSKIQFINKNAEVTKIWNRQLCMTSWDTLYYRLRANFDGLQSNYVTVEGRAADIREGTSSYEFGCNVVDIKHNNNSVELKFERSTGGGGTLQADLIIAADGPASGIRRILCPDTERNYVGYVAWRGTVVESQISENTRALFGTSVNYFIYSKGHVLVYLIPGKNGSLKPGERLLNYVWYCNYAANSAELQDLMTDAEGHRHRITMPMDKLRPDISARQNFYADKILPAAFAEVVGMTTQPFVQCITDVATPKAVFFDGHLLLAGDALCTFRPHVGSSTNQAALHALLLRRTLPSYTLFPSHQHTEAQVAKRTDDLTFEAYESQVLQYAKLTSLTSVAWGNKNQFSLWIFLGSVFWLVLAYAEVGVAKMWDWVEGMPLRIWSQVCKRRQEQKIS